MSDATITAALRAAVLGSGVSAAEVARSAGVDPGQVSRWLRGERDIRLATADAILRGLSLIVTITREDTPCES